MSARTAYLPGIEGASEMARKWIVVGDTTTGGGTVVSGSPTIDIDGFPIGRLGDPVICSRHGPTSIASGDASQLDDNLPWARHGDYCACGCQLMAIRQFRAFVESGPSAGAAIGAGPLATTSKNSSPEGTANVRFDEQIQFVTARGINLACVAYVLHLEDGSTVVGTADSEGKTTRVATAVPQKILKAELTPPGQWTACCSQESLPVQKVEVEVKDVATNPEQVGTSIMQVSTEAEDRVLTAGEIAMLRRIFANSVDYASVRLHNHGYWLLFGFQPNDTATAPNGEIYLPVTLFSEDFSTDRNRTQRLLVHEMTHVWQYQLGYPLKRVRGPRPNMSYAYTLELDKQLCDYNMEAQGNIIADYFLLKIRSDPKNLYEETYQGVSNPIPLYEHVLRDFLIDPADRANLPKVTK